ncbi:MAG: hypothetical protein HN975_16410 [Anaerolineae bacterium]|jgi:flavin-dependent dehydrogenase|nr:hypothetical protein [Anaerolineae bacterium]MBT7072463.1 hypothetical protein [Anaerolineae bacterium]
MQTRLKDGDHVGIIGGGPAGSFAAIHLLTLSRQHNLDLQVTIFEPRDFNRPGLSGCNRCAGILSSRLLRGLKRLGIQLPPDVIQANLQTYAICLDNETLEIQQPDPSRRIVSIYRGGGPRLLQEPSPTSFDAFMLKKAIALGAKHLPQRVRVVHWEKRPIIHTGRNHFPVDFLILATGINSRPPLSATFGYHPPKTVLMAQDEILLPPSWPANQVRAYFRKPSGLLFGALIPKGKYINISLLGKGLTNHSIEDFIAAQNLSQDLQFTPESRLCGCTPQIAVSSARRFYGNRWVTVGDSAVTRLYKDGIGSAFYTTQAAMRIAIEYGISQRAFGFQYAPYCRRIARDNLYGRLLFTLWQLTLRSEKFLHAWMKAIHSEQKTPSQEHVHSRILWGMLTGDEPYKKLFWLSVRPQVVLDLLRHIK